MMREKKLVLARWRTVTPDLWTDVYANFTDELHRNFGAVGELAFSGRNLHNFYELFAVLIFALAGESDWGLEQIKG